MRRSWTAPVAILALVVGQLFAPWGPAIGNAATATNSGALSVSAGYHFTCAISIGSSSAVLGC